MSNNKILTNLIRTVTSIEGKFHNLFINETLIDFFMPIGNILCCESNYGCNKLETYNPPQKRKKKNNNNKKYKRKKQGNGTQMNSQIQFHVRSKLNPIKIYKIKVFRNETFQIPGILKADFSDVTPSLIELRDYFRSVLVDNSIEIGEIYPTLTNYKCRLIDNNLKIKLPNIVAEIESYKKNNSEQKIIFNILDSSSKINNNSASLIKKYIPINRYGIAELKFEQERVSSVVTVKFYRPSLRNTKDLWIKKKSTIKIFQSGKINLDAVKTYEESLNLYNWLDKFIKDVYNKIIYDISLPCDDSSDSDSDSD